VVFPVPAAVKLGLSGIIGVLFVVMAAPMLLSVAYVPTRAAWLAFTGEQATGVVTGTVSHSSSEGSATAARVRFVDRSGRVHWVEGGVAFATSRSGRPRNLHAVGERVRVLYPVGRPDAAILADGKSIAVHLALILFIAPVIGVGVWLIRRDPEGWDDGMEPG